MNPHTGEIRRLTLDDLRQDERRFMTLPPELQPAAKLKMRGEESAQVNLRSNHPLARWAEQARKAKKLKAKKLKAKTAAASRRRNRK